MKSLILTLCSIVSTFFPNHLICNGSYIADIEHFETRNITSESSEFFTSGNRDIVLITHLRNTKEAIEKYEYFHSSKGVWPQVVEAARVSGITKIMIYRFERTLVMIITIPQEADFNEISKKYAASSPKLKEWAELMATFQVAPRSLKEGEIWAPMKLIHHYENGEVYDH